MLIENCSHFDCKTAERRRRDSRDNGDSGIGGGGGGGGGGVDAHDVRKALRNRNCVVPQR